METDFPITQNSFNGLFEQIGEGKRVLFDGQKYTKAKEAPAQSFISLMMEIEKGNISTQCEDLSLSNFPLDTEIKRAFPPFLLDSGSIPDNEMKKTDEYTANLSANINPLNFFNGLDKNCQDLQKDCCWPDHGRGDAFTILGDRAIEKGLLVKTEFGLQKTAEVIPKEGKLYSVNKSLLVEQILLNEDSNSLKSAFFFDEGLTDKSGNLEGADFLLKSVMESMGSDKQCGKTGADKSGNLAVQTFLSKSAFNDQKSNEISQDSKLIVSTAEAVPRVEFGFKNSKLTNQKANSFSRNLISHESVNIEADDVTMKIDNEVSDSVFYEDRPSYKLVNTALSLKEAEPNQKAGQTEFLAQIVEKAVLQVKSNQPEIKITLKPEFLGQLKLRISTMDHQVIVRILTESPLIKEIIENNIDQLKAALQSQGLEIDKLDVCIAQDSGHKGNGYENNTFSNIEGEIDDEEQQTVMFEEAEESNSVSGESTGLNLIDFFA